MICEPCARLADAGETTHGDCEDIARFFDLKAQGKPPLGDLPMQRSCTCQHDGARRLRSPATAASG